jgi:hypothetical protein
MIWFLLGIYVGGMLVCSVGMTGSADGENESIWLKIFGCLAWPFILPFAVGGEDE